MTSGTRRPIGASAHLLTIMTAAIVAFCVFAADLLTALHGAVAVLYTTVVLIVARTNDRRAVLISGVVCAALAVAAWLKGHWGQDLDSAALRLVVSLTAIAITTILSIRNNTAQNTLSEQARILELTHDTVIIRGGDDVIVYWNDGAEHLYGWSREEAVGRRSADLLETRPLDGDAPHLSGNGRWSGEITRLRKDGTRLLLASRWFERLDQNGRPIGIIETSTDVTEARALADARRRSEERYQAIFNAAGFPVWETDLSSLLEWPDGDRYDLNWLAERAIVRNANDAAGALFGLPSRHALIGLSTISFYPPEQAGALRRIWSRLRSGESSAAQETRIITADGRSVDILLHITVPDGEDAWQRVLAMAVDVTERNRVQARLVQAQAELTHVGRVTLLGQLAASIAHEVNQPLSAIVTYAKSGRRWLKQEAEQAPEVENCLDHIVSNGARAAEVIARVRALARKSEPQRDVIAVAALLEETVALLHRDLHSHQVRVEITAPDWLPTVHGDRVQIQQVLMNLLMNAEQAMADTPPEDRAICVDVSLLFAAIQITVVDCGIGIGEDPERLFRPFFTTKSEGMGMGLSICRSIVEQHGGTLTASDAIGRGAAFRFTLPLAAQLEGEAA